MRWCQLLLLARLTRRAAHVVGRGRSTADALLDAMLDEEDQLVADGWAGRVSAQCEVLTRVEQLLAAAPMNRSGSRASELGARGCARGCVRR